MVTIWPQNFGFAYLVIGAFTVVPNHGQLQDALHTRKSSALKRVLDTKTFSQTATFLALNFRNRFFTKQLALQKSAFGRFLFGLRWNEDQLNGDAFAQDFCMCLPTDRSN